MKRRLARALFRMARRVDPNCCVDFRTIKYAGQLAGVGVNGLLETFDAAGEQAGSDWFNRIVSGLAGQRPTDPNGPGRHGGP